MSSLKPLLNNQTVRIDTHHRGNKEILNWDMSHQDIHLDKDTEYKINGRKQRIRIKLPLNSDRPISITTRYKREGEIPNNLKKEVQNVFQDAGFRNKIVAQLSDILDNYPSKILEDKQKLEIVIDKICIAFGILPESLRKDIDTYSHGECVSKQQKYADLTSDYTLKINNQRIQLTGKNK